MTPIEIVGGLFGLFAIGLIVLLIYKSTLTMHEDDQLFLDEANSHMQEEQTELLTKVNRLTTPMRVYSIGAGVLVHGLSAMLIYRTLSEVQWTSVQTRFYLLPVVCHRHSARRARLVGDIYFSALLSIVLS